MRRVRHQESTPSPAGGVWRGWRTGDPRRWLRQWVFCPCTGPTWGPCCGNRYLAAHDRARNAAGGGRAARDRVSGSRCGAAAGRLCRAVVRHGDVVHGLAGHARRRERVSGVHTRLRPGCRFVASITHPCTDTPFRVWEKDQSGAKRWLCIDRYFERGSFEYTWSEWGQDLTTEGSGRLWRIGLAGVSTPGFSCGPSKSRARPIRRFGRGPIWRMRHGCRTTWYSTSCGLDELIGQGSGLVLR